MWKSKHRTVDAAVASAVAIASAPVDPWAEAWAIADAALLVCPLDSWLKMNAASWSALALAGKVTCDNVLREVLPSTPTISERTNADA